MNKKTALSLISLMSFGLMQGMEKYTVEEFMLLLQKQQSPVKTGSSSFLYKKSENAVFALEDELSQKREAFDRSIENKIKQQKEKKQKNYEILKNSSLLDPIAQSIESYFRDWVVNPKSTKKPSFKEVVQPVKSCLKKTSSYSSSSPSSPRSGQTTPEIISPDIKYYQRK